MQPVAASTSMYTFAVSRKSPNFFQCSMIGMNKWTESHSSLFDVLPKKFKFASLCAQKKPAFTYFNKVHSVYSD